MKLQVLIDLNFKEIENELLIARLLEEWLIKLKFLVLIKEIIIELE